MSRQETFQEKLDRFEEEKENKERQASVQDMLDGLVMGLKRL